MDKRGRGQRHLNHRSRPPEVGVPQTKGPGCTSDKRARELRVQQTKGPARGGCTLDKWARPRWVYLRQIRLRWVYLRQKAPGVPRTNGPARGGCTSDKCA